MVIIQLAIILLFVMQECGRQLLAGYSWQMAEADEKLDYKTLPVLRPVKDVQALFRKK